MPSLSALSRSRRRSSAAWRSAVFVDYALARSDQVSTSPHVFLPDGTAAKCSFCPRPAVAKGWAMHRLFGLLPVFPRNFYYCENHRR